MPVQRRVLLFSANALFIALALCISYLLSAASPFASTYLHSLWILPDALLIGIPIHAITGLYKGSACYVGIHLATVRLQWPGVGFLSLVGVMH